MPYVDELLKCQQLRLVLVDRPEQVSKPANKSRKHQYRGGYEHHRSMRRAARMRPTPRLKTAAARNSAPTYARFINPFGCVAVGKATDRKKAEGIRIAAIGAPVRAIHFQKGESAAWSTYKMESTLPVNLAERFQRCRCAETSEQTLGVWTHHPLVGAGLGIPIRSRFVSGSRSSIS